MIRKFFSSLSVTCAFLAAANAHASFPATESAQPNAFELAYMGYQGMFLDWGLPSDGAFCADVNNRIMIAQDLAYAYLLHIGHVDALLRPAEGAPVAQGQAQVKGKDLPVSQGQSQAQAQAKAKDLPVSQGQSQTQAQAKAKDIPVSQGQSQTQAQVKAKDIPMQQGQTQAQAQAKSKDTTVSQAQSKFIPKGGKLIPVQQQQSRSAPGVMLSDLNLRRFVDYTNALTEDEVQLVRDNFDNQFLDDLYLRMRDLCRE